MEYRLWTEVLGSVPFDNHVKRPKGIMVIQSLLRMRV